MTADVPTTRAISDEAALVRRLFVALTEQRVLDIQHYGATVYAPITMDDARDLLAQSSGRDRGADHAREVIEAHIAAVLERHSEGEPVELMLHYDSDIECQQCSDGDGHLVPVCNGCYPTWEDVPGHSVWPCIEAREAMALRAALAADEVTGR